MQHQIKHMKHTSKRMKYTELGAMEYAGPHSFSLPVLLSEVTMHAQPLMHHMHPMPSKAACAPMPCPALHAERVAARAPMRCPKERTGAGPA